MTRIEELTELQIKHNEACECKLKKVATQPVFGEGSPDARIVFVGEAPGKKEDETGKPFIGAAGKFLTEMLATIGMKRDDIYITNIVKYRPPHNRDPEEHEKHECASWLHDEINFIKPDVVVFLGRHSMTHFLPELKISEAHGKLVHRRIPNFAVEYFFPLYHPAAALYNGGMRETLMDDFQKIPKVLEKIRESKNQLS